jgi:hypothetical protein
MTVIAWDGVTVAADRKSSGTGPDMIFNKIFRLDSGEVAAIFGNARNAYTLLEWKRGNLEEFPTDFSDEGKMLVFGNGYVSFYSTRSKGLAIPVLDEFMAWGTGADVAVGALAAGADSVRAVEIACRYNSGCGLGLDSLKVSE